MDNRLYGESVSDAVVEHEEKAAVYGLTVAKVGIASIPLMFAPTSPLAAMVGVALSETVGFAVSRISEKKQSRVIEVVKRVVGKVGEPALSEKLESDEEYAELFQNGVLEAAKSKLHQRREVISNFLASSLIEEGKLFQKRRDLDTISRLGDLEFIVFSSFQSLDYETEHDTTTIYQLSVEDAREITLNALGEKYDLEERIPDELQQQLDIVLDSLVTTKVMRHEQAGMPTGYFWVLSKYGERLAQYLEPRDYESPYYELTMEPDE